jgi:PKD repeat protein
MKFLTTLFVLLLIAGNNLLANHIRGGELSYKYLGPGRTANTSRYMLTLKLYIDCFQNNQGQFDRQVPFTIFDRSTNRQIGQPEIAPFSEERRISYDPNSNPCITNPPSDICYNLRFYYKEIELPNTPQGYIISFQRCCRIAGIRNISGNSDDTGATYFCEIPGTDILPSNEHNSSPVVSGNDAVAICAGTNFTFDFSASDGTEKDSLSYALCSAYNGGGQTQGENCYTCPTPNPAAPPPYITLPYRPSFPGSTPLGINVSIDPKTGIVRGTAPVDVGQYVVSACISEFRNGKLINIHRKDIHLTISDCLPLKAVLAPDYKFCDDFLVTFQNGQMNPAGSLYIWNYGDGTKPDTANTALGGVEHRYADTGSYTVKLKVILAGGQCLDSTTTIAKVYPGFFPGFVANGSCLLTPFSFVDTTFSRYGNVTRWSWDFGDETSTTDVSELRNPVYKYNTLGFKTVTLNVESRFGCTGTATAQIEVRDKPNLVLPFKDTLICSIDTLPLIANAPGTLDPTFSWTPGTNILNANTANPLVFPKTTTTYSVTLNDNGCVATDNILVRVVDEVTLSTAPDTTICLTDPVMLRAFGDGLRYEWTPAVSMNDPQSRTPFVTPTTTTTYTVTSRIGNCFKTDELMVRTVPYPGANAGQDVFICYDDTTQLNATIAGSAFTWTPANSLIDAQSLNPLAYPRRSTAYVLTVTDNIGCPKPGRDTVFVGVRPPVRAFAGNDTSIVVGQPLQLNARGGDIYQWSPSFGLNASNINNPVANLSQNQTYQVRVSTPEDCFAFDTINITVFKTNPDIFVPNAFTPGRTANAIFRPIPVGISQFDFFRIYNRYGQMVFSTSEAGRGWDGRIGGKEQGTGSYVWMVQGRDFTGKMIFKKGTVVLIR